MSRFTASDGSMTVMAFPYPSLWIIPKDPA